MAILLSLSLLVSCADFSAAMQPPAAPPRAEVMAFFTSQALTRHPIFHIREKLAEPRISAVVIQDIHPAARPADLDEVKGPNVLTPTHASVGFMGKFVALTEPVYDRERGRITFRARHIETGGEQEVQIPAEAVSIDDVHNVLRLGSDDPYNKIVDWVLYGGEFKGEFLIIKENEYGIHGLGSRGLIAVGEAYRHSPTAWFHETGEAMGAAGKLNADYMVSHLREHGKDAEVEWYESKMQEPRREGLELHYALRALQKAVQHGDDRELTLLIQGRLTRPQALQAVRQKGVKNYGPLLSEFRRVRDQQAKGTQESDLRLLNSLIEARLVAERKEAEEAEREAERARARQEDEVRQRALIVSIFNEMEKVIDSKEGSSEERIGQATASFDRVNDLEAVWVADEVLKTLRAQLQERPWMLSWKLFPIYFKTRWFQRLNPRVIALVLQGLFKDFSKGGSYYPQRSRILRMLNELLRGLKTWDERYLDGWEHDLLQALELHGAGRLTAPSYLLTGVPNLTDYFEGIPGRSDRLYFRKDFDDRVKRIRDSGIRKRLLIIRLEQGFNRKSVVDLFDNLMATPGASRLYAGVAGLLEAPAASDAVLRGTLFDLLAKNTKPGQAGYAERVTALVDQITRDYASLTDEELRRDRLISLDRLVVQELPAAAVKQIFDVLSGDVPGLAQQATDHARALRQEEPALRQAAKSGDAAARKRLRQLHHQLNESMEALERRIIHLAHLTEMVLPADHSAGERMLEFLIEVAGNNAWDPSVAAAAMARVTPFAVSGETKAIQYIHSRLPSGPVSNDRLQTFLKTDTPDEEIVRTLKQIGSSGQRRIGLLLLRKFSKKADFLKDVILDESMPGEFRLYAFAYYAGEFLEKKDEVKIESKYEEEAFRELSGPLLKVAEDLVRSRLEGSVAWLTDLFDDVPLQNEESKVYAIATALALQRRVPLSSAKGFALIGEYIEEAQLKPYWNNATNRFVFGGALLRRTDSPAALYFQVLAHEIMHDILLGQIDYATHDLSHKSMHELMADLHADAFSEQFGLPVSSFEEAMDYTEDFEEVAHDDFNAIESHEAARAQLTIIRSVLRERGLTLDVNKALRSGMNVLGRKLNDTRPLHELVTLLLQDYLGQTPAAPGPESDDDIFLQSSFMSKVIGGLENDPFDVKEENLRQPVVRAESLLALLANAAAVVLGVSREPAVPVSAALTHRLTRFFGNRAAETLRRRLEMQGKTNTVRYRKLGEPGSEERRIWLEERYAPRAERWLFAFPITGAFFALLHFRGSPFTMLSGSWRISAEMWDMFWNALLIRGSLRTAWVRAQAANVRTHRRYNREHRANKAEDIHPAAVSAGTNQPRIIPAMTSRTERQAKKAGLDPNSWEAQVVFAPEEEFELVFDPWTFFHSHFPQGAANAPWRDKISIGAAMGLMAGAVLLWPVGVGHVLHQLFPHLGVLGHGIDIVLYSLTLSAFAAGAHRQGSRNVSRAVLAGKITSYWVAITGGVAGLLFGLVDVPVTEIQINFFPNSHVPFLLMYPLALMGLSLYFLAVAAPAGLLILLAASGFSGSEFYGPKKDTRMSRLFRNYLQHLTRWLWIPIIASHRVFNIMSYLSRGRIKPARLTGRLIETTAQKHAAGPPRKRIGNRARFFLTNGSPVLFLASPVMLVALTITKAIYLESFLPGAWFPVVIVSGIVSYVIAGQALMILDVIGDFRFRNRKTSLSLAQSQALAERIFHDLRENADPLLKEALDLVKGLEPTDYYTEVSNVGGKDLRRRTILYNPWMVEKPQLLKYLIVRRALGFYFLTKLGYYGTVDGVIYDEFGRHLRPYWNGFANVELYKRLHLYPKMTIYVFMSAFFKPGWGPRSLIPNQDILFKQFLTRFIDSSPRVSRPPRSRQLKRAA